MSSFRDDSENTDLGRLLIALRSDEHIGIVEQAEKFGVSACFLSRIAGGKTIFAPNTALKIYELYDGNDDVQKDFVIAWVKQYQMLKGLPVPRTSKDAILAASFLMGFSLEKETS